MKSIKLAVAGALLAASGATMADPIAVDAGWYGFCFDAGVGQAAFAGGCQNDGVGEAGNPFTFSLSGNGVLKVTDAFLHGDVFDVFVNSVLAFTTSAPAEGLSLNTVLPWASLLSYTCALAVPPSTRLSRHVRQQVKIRMTNTSSRNFDCRY